MVRSQQPTSRGRRRSPSGNDGLFGSAIGFWEHSYAPDYLGFTILFLAYMMIVLLIEPFHRMFSLDNLSISFPHAEAERVPVWLNILYAVIVPVGVIVAFGAILQPPFHKIHVTLLGLGISVILSSFITDVIKNAIGRPRPDLLSRCKAKEGTPEHILVTIDVCTETDHHRLHDGWRSFPSGHSSLAFSGLGFLALFFAGQLHVFHPRSQLSFVLISLAPLLGAALIAISRLEDYRHDFYDVTVGSILGLTVACFSYSRYYPHLKSRHCATPYPSRAEEALPGSKLKDEESTIGNGQSRTHETHDGDIERVPLTGTGRDSRSASYTR